MFQEVIETFEEMKQELQKPFVEAFQASLEQKPVDSLTEPVAVLISFEIEQLPGIQSSSDEFAVITSESNLVTDKGP